jgi:hypothetical protein
LFKVQVALVELLLQVVVAGQVEHQVVQVQVEFMVADL